MWNLEGVSGRDASLSIESSQATEYRPATEDDEHSLSPGACALCPLFPQESQAFHLRNCHFKWRTSRTTNSPEKSALFPNWYLQSERKGT